jgi:hypothetical protein
MTTRPTSAAFAFGAALLLILMACSGGTASTLVASSSAPATVAGPSTAATDVPAASADVPATSDAPAGSADAGGADDSCTLVTKDAVSVAAGFPIATTSGAAGICYYQNTDQSKYLVVWRFDTQSAMASMLQIEAGSEHVDGLGDDAFWAGVGGILFVRKGDHGAEFQDPDYTFSPDTDTATRDRMVTLARTALAAL